jgi:phosphatidylinositol kinase/protein kinase (PI-3  family)
MEICNMMNQMMGKDFEAIKRNLKIPTFFIMPLNRNTGLIQWINETRTLKGIVAEYWRKDSIKGEMQEIKRKA